jgi:metal transporter CNNM
LELFYSFSLFGLLYVAILLDETQDSKSCAKNRSVFSLVRWVYVRGAHRTMYFCAMVFEYMIVLIVVILVLFSGLFSGLTLGLMGLNTYELRRKAALGDVRAKRVYAVRHDGNLLLTTLLVGNVAVNTALSIFLGTLAPGIIAGIVATTLIVIFGEIVPQATFSRYGLAFGARVVWLVRFFIILLYPICKPIAIILDKVLGAELPTMLSKRELIRIVEEHRYSHHSDVDDDEEQIIRGALLFSTLRAKDVMTRRDRVFMLDAQTALTDDVLDRIREEGYARIPVYTGTKATVKGILYAKELLGRKLAECMVGDIMHTTIVRVHEDQCLDAVLETFIASRKHLAIVENDEENCIGVVALEDILEEILREEIEDESDIER